MKNKTVAGRLSFKQRRFALEYLATDGNATEAAKRAGYSPKTAYSQGQRLLKHVEVQKIIREKLEEADLTAANVLKNLRRIGMFDIRTLFDADGNLKPVAAWTAEQGAVVSSFEVIKKNAAACDGRIETIYKFRFWYKNDALETLCKHLGLLQPDATPAPAGPVFLMPEGTKIAIE